MNIFTDEDKTTFLACDTYEKFQSFINSYEIDKVDKSGNTILHYYLLNFDSFKLDPASVVLALHKRGIDINAQSTINRFRHIPLNLTIKNELKDVFDLLIKLGADVNIKMANGNTVLFNVLMKLGIGNDYFISELIKNGANVYLENDHGVSPISLAYTISNYDYKRHFKNFEYKPKL